MVTEDQINDLVREQQAAQAVYDEVCVRLQDARVEMAWQKSGLAPGDIIVCNGNRFKAVDFTAVGTLVAQRIRKDGSVGKVEHIWRTWSKIG